MLLELVDKLVDRLVELATYRKKARRELFEDHVVPVFEAFEAIHREYLASFDKYRETLRSSASPLEPNHPLLETIRKDNLFTEHERMKITQLGQAVDDPEVGPFAAAVRDYLVDTRVADDPLAGYRTAPFRNPQLWRRSLLRELETVFNGNWQVVLDRCSSAPPLYGKDLENALAEVRREAGINEDDPRKTDRTKEHFAVRALDEVVGEMQSAYGRVANEYATLRAKLRR